MYNRHQTSKPAPADFGQTETVRWGADGPLAYTGSRGEARIQELEYLVKTAQRVVEYARRQLTEDPDKADTYTSQLEISERTVRRAEAEITEIRAALGADTDASRPEVPPGVKNPFLKDDFDLAIAMGSRGGRLQDGRASSDAPKPAPAASAILPGKPRTPKRRHSAGKIQPQAAESMAVEPVQQPPIAVTRSRQPTKTARNKMFFALMATGVGIGAVASYLAVQHAAPETAQIVAAPAAPAVQQATYVETATQVPSGSLQQRQQAHERMIRAAAEQEFRTLTMAY